MGTLINKRSISSMKLLEKIFTSMLKAIGIKEEK